MIIPSMSQKTVSETFFTDCYAQNFFFTEESVFQLYRCSFWHRHILASHFNPILWYYQIIYISQETKIWYQTTGQAWSALFEQQLFRIDTKLIFCPEVKAFFLIWTNSKQRKFCTDGNNGLAIMYEIAIS